MTRVLDRAIARLATLSAQEQDRFGQWLLEELENEERWAKLFRESRDVLKDLATEARGDRSAGRTTDLTFDGQ